MLAGNQFFTTVKATKMSKSLANSTYFPSLIRQFRLHFFSFPSNIKYGLCMIHFSPPLTHPRTPPIPLTSPPLTPSLSPPSLTSSCSSYSSSSYSSSYPLTPPPLTPLSPPPPPPPPPSPSPPPSLIRQILLIRHLGW